MFRHATRADSAELAAEKPAVQPRAKKYLDGAWPNKIDTNGVFNIR